MEPFALVALGIAGMIAYALWSYVRKRERREALNMFATRSGWTYSVDDPIGLPALPLDLFAKGDGRGCENVIVGEWKKRPIVAADYWYYTQSTDSKGNTSRSYRHFSVLLTRLAASLGKVSIRREGVASRLADALTFRDLQFESGDFNRRFDVKADDPQFAFKLVDPRMMEWLLGMSGSFNFEVNGQHVLAYCDRLDPSKLPHLFTASDGFLAHIPRLVWDENGTPRAGAPGDG